MQSLTKRTYGNLRNIAGLAAIAALAAGCCGSTTTRTAQYRAPAYAGGTYETTTTEAATPQPAPTAQVTATAGEKNMVVPLYQEQINVGKREEEAGSVRLKKIVRTETVNVPVELRHEEVVIDRDNNAKAGQSSALGQPFQQVRPSFCHGGDDNTRWRGAVPKQKGGEQKGRR